MTSTTCRTEIRGNPTAYRTPAERPKEIEPMNDNEMMAHIVKYLVLGAAAGLLLGAGTCAYTTHDGNVASVTIEERKAEAAKAERDRAMFEGMNRAPKAP